MRVLIDSSVLVAAYISRAGVCAGLLEDVLMDHDWVISNFILDELARKLKEKLSFSEDDIADIRMSIINAAEIVEPAEVHPESCRDPNDLPVLGTAIAGRADVLVTVDKDLLYLSAHRGIPIIRPGEFWKRLEQGISLP